MTSFKPWTQKVYELLSKGPQPRRTLVEAAMLSVPSGRAAHEGAAKQARDDKYAGRELKGDQDAARVRKGAQALVLKSIRIGVETGKIERYEEDGRMMLRLTEKGKVAA